MDNTWLKVEPADSAELPASDCMELVSVEVTGFLFEDKNIATTYPLERECAGSRQWP